MSLYNALFGVNNMAPLLLKVLDIDQNNKNWSSGRFRDIFLNEDGTKILLYTRNGGGNRECCCDNVSWYANEECKHEERLQEVDEKINATKEEAELHPEWTPYNVFIGNKRLYKTGKKVMEKQYRCISPDSEECSCTGCIITYRLPKHPNYITDYDDDFDCTYATIEFSIPTEFENDMKLLAIGENPDTISDKFKKLIEKIRLIHFII